MKAGDIVVRVMDGRCLVCRLQDANFDPESDSWYMTPAENVDELETEATRYVLGGCYPCPPELAALARWPDGNPAT